jgi:predicted ferric reductase
VLLAGYLALVLAPLGLAALSGTAARSAIRELGLGAGLVAYAMLLLQFISSGRFEALSGRTGIDRTMRFHQLAARLAALLVLLHFVLLVMPRALHHPPRAPHVLDRILQAPHLQSGVVALVLVVLVVALGILRDRLRLRYELWRASHAVAAVAIALAGGHHALSARHAGSGPLIGFWWALLVMALASLVYVYLVKPVLLARRAYRVSAVEPVGRGLWEIALEPARGRAIAFRAGQFAWAGFARLPIPFLDHPFSLASAPSELPRVRLLVQERGDFTATIGALPVGSPVYLDAPHGHFTPDGRAAEAFCLIAGGVGIAPILSMLREFRAADERRPIALVYAARTLDRLAYREEIDAMARDLDLRVRYVLAEPPATWTGHVGLVDRAVIDTALRGRDPARLWCFLCGPTGMMLALEDQLREAGVPAGRILYERFTYDGPDGQSPGWWIDPAILATGLALVLALWLFAAR